MTKLKDNSIMKTASHKHGNTVACRQLTNGKIIGNRPTTPPTVHETLLGIRSKFKDATQYAKFQMKKVGCVPLGGTV